MKTNLKSKRNPPTIVFLSECEVTLSLFYQGQFHVIQQNCSKNMEFELPTELCKNLKVVIVLSNHLVLYSQLKLPLGLADEEVAELVALQLARRGQDSQLDTYYDYCLVRELDDNAIFSLFEARKDKLNSIIDALEDHGFKVSMIIPQGLVIINQIIRNNNLVDKNYQIICRLQRQILMAYIDKDELLEIHQIYLNPNQIELSIVAELKARQSETKFSHVISLGLDLFKLNEYADDVDINFVDFESLSTGNDLTSVTINWMREQYDIYQSITLA